MTARDYLLLGATETSPGRPAAKASKAVLADYRAYLGRAKVTAAQADAILATKMGARREAAAAPGRFPLVIIVQGNGGSAYDQAFLAEILAEHGYAVATMPSQARISGPMRTEGEIAARAIEEAADIGVAAGALAREPSVKPGDLGLVGYSFGARSALLYEMRHRGVSAFVSLDGGIGAKTGKGRLEKAEGFDPKRAEAPLMHIYEDGDRFMPVDLDLIRSLDRSDRWLVKVEGMRHTHFSTMGILVRSSPQLAAITSATPGTAAAWDAVAAATVAFLDRFLGNPRPNEAPAAWTPPASPSYTVKQLPGFARPAARPAPAR